jgi:choline dehydrogenase-like flavoprotein
VIISLEEYDAGTPLQAAVCIIGAGAAGLTLACELDGSGIKVLLLEAGGLRMDAAADDVYRGSAEAPHPSPSEFRRVVFGGTTGTWGGRCVPFDPIDFEKRDYVPGSGWPISYGDVARFYPRAMDYCDAGAFDFSVAKSLPAKRAGASAKAPLPTIPGLNDESVILADRIERYSLPTDFGKRYRTKIEASANVSALLNARCVALQRRAGEQKIASVSVADRAGKRREVSAQIFVLAAGGIEATRLLLLSEIQSDCLGRFYACHFENTLGRVVVKRGEAAFDFEKTLDGVYCRRKLQFTAGAQRQHRLLNSAFRLHFPSFLQHGTEAAVQSPKAAHVRNVLSGMPALGKFAYQWLFQRQLAARKLPYTLVKNRDGSYPLEFNSEQTPQASSRIVLGDEQDRDGLRRVRVEWRLSEEDAQAAQRGFLLLQEVLRDHSDCRLEIDPAALLPALRRSVPLGGHHMGTARMASSAHDGVVDGNCALFELPNLFVASAAVFRTNSHANPTLTIVALALRLAEHLKSLRLAAA